MPDLKLCLMMDQAESSTVPPSLLIVSLKTPLAQSLLILSFQSSQIITAPLPLHYTENTDGQTSACRADSYVEQKPLGGAQSQFLQGPSSIWTDVQ